MSALTQAVFKQHAGDFQVLLLALTVAHGLSSTETEKAKRWMTAKLIRMKVRRLIPPPLELRHRVVQVKYAFQDVENDGVKLAGEKWERV
mmetsp:Transcript_30960/g.61037  ORF Transcript_30960/g.61037 Transcript_30960/m.61037 type:complete len:90 (+) Transcript_30960:263-532(+)